MLLGSVLVSRPDVLIATSPQLFVGVAGYVLSRIKACAFVFEVRDLWPRGIVEVGAMREGKMFRLLERLERFLYHQADKVVVVTDGMKEDLVRRGIPGKKIWVIPNGVESDVFEKNGVTVRQELGLNGKFVVAYVGTHGMTQGLHAVLEAADLLRDHSGVQFLCVGEGSEKEDLVYAKQRRGLANVRFLPQQPRDRARAILTAADAVLVPLRKLPLFEITVPSKLFEGMAAAKPILLGVRGEARRIVEQAGCGYAYDPENGTALADSIRRLLQTPDRGRSMGEAGRSYVLTHYSRREQAERYAALLEKVAV
jgi:glycosyltransferase involved in cell wall biosynthesis